MIESVNGQKVASPRDLALTVAAVAPGDDAKFQVLRDGQDREIEVKVGEQPPEKTARAQPGEPTSVARSAWAWLWAR